MMGRDKMNSEMPGSINEETMNKVMACILVRLLAKTQNGTMCFNKKRKERAICQDRSTGCGRRFRRRHFKKAVHKDCASDCMEVQVGQTIGNILWGSYDSLHKRLIGLVAVMLTIGKRCLQMKPFLQECLPLLSTSCSGLSLFFSFGCRNEESHIMPNTICYQLFCIIDKGYKSDLGDVHAPILM